MIAQTKAYIASHYCSNMLVLSKDFNVKACKNPLLKHIQHNKNKNLSVILFGISSSQVSLIITVQVANI